MKFIMFALADVDLFPMNRENVKASGVSESETRLQSADVKTENTNPGLLIISPAISK